MRIIAGTYRGRVLESPSEKTTRPTTDRVRESIFSSLYSRLGKFEGVRVLDAFAGSGALGIEALSRGADSCDFFERDAQARRILDRNLRSLGIDQHVAQVHGADVLQAAREGLHGTRAPFGLVLLDPPYALAAEEVGGLLVSLLERDALGSGAVVAYEHAVANRPEVLACFEGSPRFEVTGQKKYGRIGVTYLKRR